jgi:hypothetical protein
MLFFCDFFKISNINKNSFIIKPNEFIIKPNDLIYMYKALKFNIKAQIRAFRHKIMFDL